MVETAAGAFVGLAVGNLLIAAIGTGPAQVAAVTFLAMATATALGAEPGVVTQAGITSVLIATVEPPHGLYNTVAVDRLIDIFVGGAVGIAASVLPRPNPLASTQSAAEPLFRELSGALERVADALDARDVSAAERALEQARGLDGDLQEFRDALDLAEESVRFVPHYRQMRPALARWRVADRPLEFAMRNVRVLARGAVRVIALDPQPPAALSIAVRELASAVRAVQRNLQGGHQSLEAEAAVVRAAVLATLVLEGGATMPVSSIVAQVRSATTDLSDRPRPRDSGDTGQAGGRGAEGGRSARVGARELSLMRTTESRGAGYPVTSATLRSWRPGAAPGGSAVTSNFCEPRDNLPAGLGTRLGRIRPGRLIEIDGCRCSGLGDVPAPASSRSSWPACLVDALGASAHG